MTSSKESSTSTIQSGQIPGTAGPMDSHQIRKRIMLIAIILLLGVLSFSALIFFRESPPKSRKAVVATPVVVETIAPVRVTSRVRGMGTVAARRLVRIRPEVSGQIVDIPSELVLGANVVEGQILFQIDPQNYELAREEAKAQLKRAAFELTLEEGNQTVAAREWKLLKELGVDSDTMEQHRNLALRKPHLDEKRAQVAAAKSRLQRTELDLERTVVRAPFNGTILRKTVEIGGFASPQETVLEIAGTDQFEIEVEIPRSELRWLSRFFREGDSIETSYAVEVFQRVGNGIQFQRVGVAERLVGEVQREGRMARILVTVDTPLAVQAAPDFPLLLGSAVEVVILGDEIQNVYPIPFRAIREGNVIWSVSAENTLDIVPVETITSDRETVYVRGNLPEKFSLVTSALSGALKGLPLVVNGELPQEQSDQEIGEGE